MFQLQTPIPMTATGSSFLDGSQWDWDMAINGIQDGSDYDDLFHSEGENYPWLAIDLGFFYKVRLSSLLKSVTLLDLLLGHRGVNGGAEWLLCF